VAEIYRRHRLDVFMKSRPDGLSSVVPIGVSIEMAFLAIFFKHFANLVLRISIRSAPISSGVGAFAANFCNSARNRFSY